MSRIMSKWPVIARPTRQVKPTTMPARRNNSQCRYLRLYLLHKKKENGSSSPSSTLHAWRCHLFGCGCMRCGAACPAPPPCYPPQSPPQCPPLHPSRSSGSAPPKAHSFFCTAGTLSFSRYKVGEDHALLCKSGMTRLPTSVFRSISPPF